MGSEQTEIRPQSNDPAVRSLDDATGVDGPTTFRAAVTAELRTLVSRRSRAAVRDHPSPALGQLLPDTEDAEERYAALQRLLDEAISRIPDTAHRTAAEVLVGFGPRRWLPLLRRGPEAAAAFGIGWDAYRRMRPNRDGSLLTDTLDEVTTALLGPGSLQTGTDPVIAAGGPPVAAKVALDPAAPATAPDAPTPPTPEPSPRTSGTWSGQRLGLAAVLVILLGVVGVVLATRRGEEAPATAASSCGNLTYEVGEAPAGAAPEILRWSEPFAAAAARLPAELSTCAGLMHVVDGTVLQAISSSDSVTAGALAAPLEGEGEVIHLSAEEHRVHRLLAAPETTPSNRLGAPVRRIGRPGAQRLIEFTHGFLASEGADSLVVAVTGAMAEEWIAAGGVDGPLGFPLSEPYDRAGTARYQDFTGGWVLVDYLGNPSHEVAEEPPEPLPAEYRGALLSTSGSEAGWFVTPEGERRWVSSTNTYVCLAALHGAAEFHDIPFRSLLDLPVGPRMPCR